MRTHPGSPPDTDRAAALRRSEAELVRLYDETVDDIYRFCLARCGDADVAADTTADVFHSAARAFAEQTGADITRAWLFTVAKNRLVDHWRRTGRHQRRVERLGQMSMRSIGPSDLGDEIPTVTAADVIDALQSLPDRQRAVLSLRYLEELSVAEIADEMSLTYTATESLLARARRSFERAWESRDPAERTPKP